MSESSWVSPVLLQTMLHNRTIGMMCLFDAFSNVWISLVTQYAKMAVLIPSFTGHLHARSSLFSPLLFSHQITPRHRNLHDYSSIWLCNIPNPSLDCKCRLIWAPFSKLTHEHDSSEALADHFCFCFIHLRSLQITHQTYFHMNIMKQVHPSNCATGLRFRTLAIFNVY